MARATEATAAPDTAEVGVLILETGFLIYNPAATLVKPRWVIAAEARRMAVGIARESSTEERGQNK
jgi:hypothetical protein